MSALSKPFSYQIFRVPAPSVVVEDDVGDEVDDDDDDEDDDVTDDDGDVSGNDGDAEGVETEVWQVMPVNPGWQIQRSSTPQNPPLKHFRPPQAMPSFVASWSKINVDEFKRNTMTYSYRECIKNVMDRISVFTRERGK